MRTLSPSQATLLAQPTYAVHSRIRIANAAGTLIDYSNASGKNWIADIRYELSTDQNIAGLTVQLHRSHGALSLATLMETSAMNAGGAAIDAGRRIIWEQATTVIGDPPVIWETLFDGTIDEVSFATTPLTITARDPAAYLIDRWVEEETVYAETEGGESLVEVMNQILGTWAPGVVLTVAGSPPAMVEAYRQQSESVYDALRTLANSIGWVIRFVWSDTFGAFVLQLYEPERTKTVPDWTHGPGRIIDVTELKINRANIRNAITVLFTDETTGDDSQVTVEHGTVSPPTGSQGRFGRQWMQLDERFEGGPIGTLSEATALANAALSDLAFPDAEYELERMFFWPVDLEDLLLLAADDIHFDVDQKWAVTGIRHELSLNRQRTFIRVRGRPAGYYEYWLNRGTRERPPYLDGIFWGTRNEDGTFDLHLTVVGDTQRFPVRADIFHGGPNGELVTTLTFTHSGETRGAGDPLDPDYIEEWDDYKPLSANILPWWAKLVAADEVEAWVKAEPAGGKPDELRLSLFDFNITRDEEAGTATASWVRASEDVEFVWIHLTEQPRNSTAYPWPVDDPQNPPVPDVSLPVGTDSYTFPLPDPAHLTYLQAEPRDVDLNVGPVERAIIDPLPAPDPKFLFIWEVPTGSFSLASLSCRIEDPGGMSGTLYVWVNKAGDEDGNPTAPADGYREVPTTPADIGPADSFITPSGNALLFQNIKKPLNAAKSVYLEFIAVDGRTTGRVQFTLKNLLSKLIDAVGDLRANSIVNAQQFAATLQPFLFVNDPTDVQSPTDGQRIFNLSTQEALKYNGTTGVWEFFNPGVEGNVGYFPAIVSGAIKTEHLDAGTVTFIEGTAQTFAAVELNANVLTALQAKIATLSEIAPGAGVIVSGAFQNAAGNAGLNLDATGTQAFLSHPGLALLANGNARFAGTITGAQVEAQGLEFILPPGQFGPTGHIGLATTGGGISMTSGAASVELVPGPGGADVVHVGGAGGIYLNTTVYGDFGDMTFGGRAVSMGPADSGGTGFRLLIVPN